MKQIPLALRMFLLGAVLVLGPAGSVLAQGSVNFSFDQMEVRSFVKLVGDLTGKKFVVSDDVSGKITVVSPEVTREEVYPLFVSILESAGCVVMAEGNMHRILPARPRESVLAPIILEGQPLPEAGLVSRVFRLQNVAVVEVRKLLEFQVGGGRQGGVGVIEETNHLIVTDTVGNIRRIEALLQEIDQPGMARITEIVALQFATADELADQLNATLAETADKAEILRNRLPRVPGSSEASRRTALVVPSPHANSLVLVGSATQVAELKRIIGQMDVDTPPGRGRMNAIFLKYVSAEEVAKSLNALLARKPAAGASSKEGRRDLAIEAMVANNALLVDALPGEYEMVRKLVDELDHMPQQVHIAVLIAEHSMTDELNLGVEFTALNMPAAPGDTVALGASRLGTGGDGLMAAIQQGLFPRGLSVGALYGTRVDAEGKVVAGLPGFVSIDALKKTGQFRIMSETALEVQNNREALVNIVNQIPVLKSTISGGSGTARDVIQNIDRIDVGIKLKLTPHIIPGGDVRMVLNPSIEAVTDPGPSGTQFTPTIAKREVSTTVTVPDGKTIVIAGLTREDKTLIERRVPLLGSIPLLGFLFRSKTEGVEKTNLLIFVTPRIVTDIADAEKVMQEWQTRTGLDHENK